MINVLCNNSNLAINIDGTLGELCAELCMITREIRRTVKEENDGDSLAFDKFLKELFAELVIADENKLGEILTKTIKSSLDEDTEDNK